LDRKDVVNKNTPWTHLPIFPSFNSALLSKGWMIAFLYGRLKRPRFIHLRCPFLRKTSVSILRSTTPERSTKIPETRQF